MVVHMKTKETQEEKDRQSQAAKTTSGRLVWLTASKDQAGIAGRIAEGEDIEEIYGLGEAGLFDEFFCFFDELKISNLFKHLEPKERKRGSNVNFSAVLLIYIMRIVSGLPFFWYIDPVILQSQSLMRLVGFNGRQVREGTTRRGLGKSKKACQKESPEDKDRLPIRGPVCPQSIGKYVSAIGAAALERFFNGVIRILAARGVGAQILSGLTGSGLKTTMGT